MSKRKSTAFCGFEWSRIDNPDWDRFRCGAPGCNRQVKGSKVWFSDDVNEFACNKQCAEDASEAEERVRNGGARSMDDVVVDGYTLREHDHMHFDHITRNYFGED